MELFRLAIKSIGLISILAIGHITAIKTDFYKGKNWIDIPLHLIGGFMLGIIWMWIINFRLRSNKTIPDYFIISSSSIGWVLFIAYIWECLEYFIYKYNPILAKTWKIYPLNLEDTLSDLFFGLLGGVFALICMLILKYRKPKIY